MPYTNAVIKELIRFTHKSTANGSTFHQMTADAIFHGYNIPKDTLIIPNFYYSMRNPEVFSNPHTFQPERFLDKNTLKNIRANNIILGNKKKSQQEILMA